MVYRRFSVAVAATCLLTGVSVGGISHCAFAPSARAQERTADSGDASAAASQPAYDPVP